LLFRERPDDLSLKAGKRATLWLSAKSGG
jgi:hypothetical protein